jgi:hypothetical protein
MINFFSLCSFSIILAKIGRFCYIFIEKLFEFILGFSYFSLSFDRFWLGLFLIGFSKGDALFGFGAFFEYGRKNGVVIVEREIVMIGWPWLFEGYVLLKRFVGGLDSRCFIEGDESVVDFLSFLEIVTGVFYGFEGFEVKIGGDGIFLSFVVLRDKEI